MKRFVTLLLFGSVLLGSGSVSAISADETKEAWVAATDALPPARWWHLELLEDVSGMRGRLSAYASVGGGFDTPILVGASFDSIEWHRDRLAGRIDLRGRELELTAERNGDLLVGVVTEGDAAHRFVARRVDTEPIDSAAIVGLYESVAEGSDVVLTWREFGGLRLIDVETNEAVSLFPSGSDALATWPSLGDAPDAVTEVAVERATGGVEHLTVRVPGRSEAVYRRRPGVLQERITFSSDGASLEGTLFRPAAEGLVPLVVLVHGSGPIYRTALVDRAVMFNELGAAAFVYDKRGTGRSEGDWRKSDFADLAADALAALRTVRELPGIDPQWAGMQGHSQAGFVIPIAAASHPEVAFVIVASGGPIDTGEQSLYDKRNDLRREGYDDAVVERALDLLERVQEWVESGRGDAARLERDYLAAVEEPWFPVLDLPRLKELPRWDDPMLADARAELAFDGGAWVRRLDDRPVLVLLGAEDETVPPVETAAAWHEHLGGDEARLRVEIVPRADHGLRLASEDGPSRRAP
ncbi:MAG: alpha/beta fold hydrolase, partial [Thermoanaerobaculia bacterium]|nr:alpha/beta fold hydrolase [Thermoanaerobaculia bacterium]